MLNKAGHVVTFDATMLSLGPQSFITSYKMFSLLPTTRTFLHHYFFPYRHLMHQEGKTLSLQEVYLQKKYFIVYDVFCLFFF